MEEYLLSIDATITLGEILRHCGRANKPSFRRIAILNSLVGNSSSSRLRRTLEGILRPFKKGFSTTWGV